MRKLALILVILLIAFGVAFVYAGRMAGPNVRIISPEKFVGVATPLEISADSPGGTLTALRVVFQQNGTDTPLFSLTEPGSAKVTHEGTTVRVVTEAGRQTISTIKPGAARIVVTGSRPVLFGLRRATTEVTRDVQVRLDRPKVFVVSTGHYINLGGSEMVVYRVSPN